MKYHVLYDHVNNVNMYINEMLCIVLNLWRNKIIF